MRFGNNVGDQAAPRKRRVPLGQDLGWTPDSIRALARAAVSDLTAARARWYDDVPRRYKRLLDAQPTEEGQD